METIKKCAEGHFYESELTECPYCNGSKKIEEMLENLSDENSGKKVKFPGDTAMCYILPPNDF
jgi:DNA-binding helix-hairpin-helix protein with protein kinase domain